MPTPEDAAVERMKPRGAVTAPRPHDDKPSDAEALFASLLRSNAADLSRIDTRLREAREQVRGAEEELARLQRVRAGLQAGRQAVLSAGGPSVAHID